MSLLALVACRSAPDSDSDLDPESGPGPGPEPGQPSQPAPEVQEHGESGPLAGPVEAGTEEPGGPEPAQPQPVGPGPGGASPGEPGPVDPGGAPEPGGHAAGPGPAVQAPQGVGDYRLNTGPLEPIEPRRPEHVEQLYHPNRVNNGWQTLNFFEPEGEPPPGGWPVLVRILLGGFSPPSPVNPLTPLQELEYRACKNGIAVVTAMVTPTDDREFPIPGRGTFEPADSEYYWSRARAETDVVHVVQWLRHQASLYPREGGLPIDPDRIVIAGSSAAAISSMWTVLGPDWADPADPENPDALGQRGQPTRVTGAILGSGATYWPAFLNRVSGVHFSHRTKPEVAQTLGGVPMEIRLAASALVYGFEDPEVAALNARIPIYLHYGGPPGSLQFEEPFPKRVLGVNQNHDAWFGYALWRRLLDIGPEARAFHEEHSRLAIYRILPEEHQGQGEEIVPRPLLEIDQFFWLSELFGMPRPCGFFHYIHKQFTAEATRPNSLRLWGEGEARPGGEIALVTEVEPEETAYFYLSIAPDDVLGPDGGFFLVDRSRLLTARIPVVADGDGVATLAYTVPDDPAHSGSSIYVQAMVEREDSYELSSGLQLTLE